eukprot:5813547-Alexandrium_andersonii.AAC.1
MCIRDSFRTGASRGCFRTGVNPANLRAGVPVLFATLGRWARGRAAAPPAASRRSAAQRGVATTSRAALP